MKKFLTLFAVLCIASTALVGAESIVLKIATVAPSRSPWDIELKKVAEEWNRITDGLVTVKIYNMSTLGGEKAGIQKLKAARPGQQAPLDGAIFTMIGLHELVIMIVLNVHCHTCVILLDHHPHSCIVACPLRCFVLLPVSL